MVFGDNNGGMGTTMLVSPTGGNTGGMGGFMGDWSILLFIIVLMCFGGWGNGMGNGGGAGNMYPWLNNSNQINEGFRDQMISSQIGDIGTRMSSGLTDIQLAICGGTRDTISAVQTAALTAEGNAANRQMQNMQMFYQGQIAQMGEFNDVTRQIGDVGAASALASCQTNNTIVSQAAETRYANANNTRDIIENDNRNHQAIMDKLCQLELDGVKSELAAERRENQNLRDAANMAAFRASQTEQNALFAQGLTNEVDALYNRLKNCPVNTVPVYGSQPIFTCGGNNAGCGCGGMAFA